MKAKVTTGKSFRGLTSYMDKPDSEFIAASTGENPADFLRQCAVLRSLRPECQKPVLHFSLSCPPGERLTKEKWRDAVDQHLEEMGLQEHDFYCKRHVDTELDHIHIEVSKIHPSGSLWNDSHSARRAMKACERLEVKYSLTKTKTLDEFREESGQRRQPLRDSEIRILERTGKPGSKRKEAIQAKIRAERERKKQDEQARVNATPGSSGRSGNEKRGGHPGAIPIFAKNVQQPKPKNPIPGSARPNPGITVIPKRSGPFVISQIQFSPSKLKLIKNSLGRAEEILHRVQTSTHKTAAFFLPDYSRRTPVAITDEAGTVKIPRPQELSDEQLAALIKHKALVNQGPVKITGAPAFLARAGELAQKMGIEHDVKHVKPLSAEEKAKIQAVAEKIHAQRTESAKADREERERKERERIEQQINRHEQHQRHQHPQPPAPWRQRP